MKKVTLYLPIAIGIAAIALFSCGNGGEELGSAQITLNNNLDSVSYAIGVSSANGLNQQFSEGNMDAYMAGFSDAIDSNELKITSEETQGIIQMYSQQKQMEQQAKQQQEQEAMYSSVKADGEKFMEDNKSTEGLQVTASGLQYIILKEGAGKQPTAASNVTVHYHGTTPDGTVFDSSVDRGETISFNLNQVIPGWTEGVALMKEGAKYKFFIPQELAYGANAPQGGQGPIKPFMPLVFEVELFSVN